jgi:ATP-dependent Lon protease
VASEKVRGELKKLKMMSPMSAEATVVRNYIDWLLGLPWYDRTRDKLDIEQAQKILDDDHYGLKKPKERILEFLAVQSLMRKIKGPIICFVGPPGVGKTSLARSIARAMGRNFIRVSLGGVRDEAEIRGHRRTYIGALPGKILQSMRRAGSVNPVFCLDEVDKMSTDFRGDPSAALLEVLDPEQNFAFNDHYLDVDYNLSEVMFITTANTLYSIPPPLQDRMEIIRLPGYTELEKLGIATQFLLPKQAKANGLEQEQVQLSDNAILEVARRYTREAGVRNLEREIASICRKVAKRLVSKGDLKGQVRVPVSAVESYLGVPKFRYGLPEEADLVGLANGLAWTETGGEVLTTEAIVMPGKGKLTITGKLGEVMQESAQAALSYVRSRGKSLGLPEDFYTKVDLHIHVPEGAIPKDGPSAGITLATALVSALTRTPVKANVAMTGEITLRGRVLPIGGLREKVLAAHRAQITQVLIPKDNEKDIKEIPQRVLKTVELIPVEHMDQVLTYALACDDPEEIFQCKPEPYVLPAETEGEASSELVAH